MVGEHVNLNDQIKNEVQPADPRASLGRLFANDLVAIDATADGQVFLIVSRGGNYVIRATLDQAGKLTIGAPDHVIRWQTGNIPNGVVSHDGRRAYVNNEVNVSVTAIDLERNAVQVLDNPAFDKDPAQGGKPLDPGVTNAAAQIVSFTCKALTFKYLENVGTFDATNPLELRGQGAASGQLALGALGFNVPSLLSIRYRGAVPAPQPSPDLGRRVPATGPRGGDDRVDAESSGSSGLAGVPECHRWDDGPLTLR